MHFPVSNRALLQRLVASAMVLAGATACSRSDRTESGSDTTAAIQTDTASPTSGVGSGTSTTPSDTASDTARTTATAADGGDTATARAQLNAPRAAAAKPQDASLQAGDEAAGYKAMEQDTSETSLNTADTTSVEAADAAQPDTATAEMARDTSTTADQIDTTTAAVSGEVAIQADTAAAVNGDVAVEATVDTVHAATGVSVEADTSAALSVQADTSANADLAIEATADTSANADLAVGVSDTAAAGEHVRPAEDSTEIRGNLSSAETADEEPVNEQEINADRTNEVGAAAVEANVTGAEAVALMDRQGVHCSMVDPESNEEVRWDMSSTPVTLNPCGLGSMNLSKVVGQRGSGAAGQ
jgi:hypothetical protein